MSGPDIRQETTLAFMAVLGNPGRLLRFAGLPLLLAIIGFGWLAIIDPMPASDDNAASSDWMSRNAGIIMLSLTLAIWGYARFLVRWFRWTLTGEDTTSLLDPGLGAPEMRMAGWSSVVGLLTMPAFLILLLPMSLLSTLTQALLAPLGESAGLAGEQLGGHIGAIIGYLGICYMQARLVPGTVPAAMGQPVKLSESWSAVLPHVRPATLILWLIALPANLLGIIALPFVGTLVEPVLSILSMLVSLVGYAAAAVFMARLWQATLGQTVQLVDTSV
jgi:hypothetical protein